MLARIGIFAIIVAMMPAVADGQSSYPADVDIPTRLVCNLSAPLEFYNFYSGRFPTSREGLRALVVRPAGLRRWNGPYWRRPEQLDNYRYRSDGQTFQLFG